MTESVQVVLKNLQGTDVAFGGNTLSRISIVDDEANFVKVEATDDEAAERSVEVSADPGVFTITRSKVSPSPLDVFFTLGGTALPGTGPGGDFNPLPNSGGIYVVTIPAFATSVAVTIQPREDTAIEGTENVVLTLQPTATYQIGVPASAEVILVDNDRPKVQMTLLDNLADEKPSPTPADFASFLIRRNIADGKSLIVYLGYGGTQILGVNYLLKYTGPDGNERTLADPLASNTVEIAPNQTDVVVTLVPIDDDVILASADHLVVHELTLRDDAVRIFVLPEIGGPFDCVLAGEPFGLQLGRSEAGCSQQTLWKDVRGLARGRNRWRRIITDEWERRVRRTRRCLDSVGQSTRRRV